MGHPKRKYDLMVLRGGPPFYVLRVDTQVSNCNIRMIDFSITLPYCQLRRPTPKDNFFDSHGMSKLTIGMITRSNNCDLDSKVSTYM